MPVQVFWRLNYGQLAGTFTVTGTVVLPATRLTLMTVGDVSVGVGALRVKLMVPGMEPAVGVTVNAPGGTPGVVTVAV